MSKLLQRLKDASRSGVYRTSDSGPLVAVARENGVSLVRIPLHGAAGKQEILESISKALGFPLPQFGHLPMILGPDKARLSKRHGATSI